MFVYILHSSSLEKFYVGQSKNVENRLARHNAGRNKYTKPGIPWELIWTFQCENRGEAMKLERKIKGRGVKRFLADSQEKS